ncbi:pentatricopeptide repeat-containing protein At1g76280 isoform X2 [Mangifera indica]|uniref:pentatricopeptide repeat-containing protein At1g76280 isoform X2 n=1 Tax=Mangifera indica TaxID=29780 RepID=UPI001CF9AAFE|nr:pentatricopeptide repeat-containing protein At1g76280 isoform X2 [Mangifera indica]
MRRSLWRIPYQRIANTLCEAKLHENGPRNVALKLELSTLTTSGHGKKSITKSMQLQIVGALCRGERSTASSLLSNLACKNQLLGANDFVHILQHCARSPDPLFAMETWRMTEEKEIGLNNRCYLLMIQSLCKGGYLDEAFNLINFLGENHGLHRFLPMYNCFLEACAKMQSMIHVNLCLELMERQMVGKNEGTYRELLELAVQQQNLSAVHEIWKHYIKHYNLSIPYLRNFTWSFSRLNDLNSAYETLQHMVALAMKRRLYIDRNYKRRMYFLRLDIPIPSNLPLSSQKVDLEKYEDVFALKMDTDTRNNEQSINFNRGISEAGSVKLCMKNKFNIRRVLRSSSIRPVLRLSFSNLIRACAQTQNSALAEKLMLQMQNLGLQPSSTAYDGFIRATVSERGIINSMEVLKIMQQKNLKPHDSTLQTLSIESSKALELDLAEALMDQISILKNLRPINAFLAACDTMDQPERAISMFAKMKQLKLQPNRRTYELLFSLFASVNAPHEEGNRLSQADCMKRIKLIEMDMAKNGVQHSHLSMNNLLKALGAEGMMREMIQYLHVAENLFSRSNTYLLTPIYNTVLHSLVEAHDIHTAIKVFQNMKYCSVPSNGATYVIMIDCCSSLRCFKSACALVSLMLREGYNLETMTYTALIKVLLEQEDFDEALNLLDQVSTEGIQRDIPLYNTFLKKAFAKGRTDVMEYIIEHMRQNGVQPDATTCWYMFGGYVERGFYSTAVEALQVLSVRMLCENGNTTQEKRIEFEDLILADDVEAESRILQFYKDSDWNIIAALLQLRWCAIMGFPTYWSTDQSLWSKRLSSLV